MIIIGVGLLVPGTLFIIQRLRSKPPPSLFALHDVQAIAQSFSTNLGCQYEIFFIDDCLQYLIHTFVMNLPCTYITVRRLWVSKCFSN
jgi:hypothetical protein